MPEASVFASDEVHVGDARHGAAAVSGVADHALDGVAARADAVTANHVENQRRVADEGEAIHVRVSRFHAPNIANHLEHVNEKMRTVFLAFDRFAMYSVRKLGSDLRMKSKLNEGKLIGYARVSTEDQELRLQIDALERAGCGNIYQEKRSGAAKKRPELDRAILDLRPGDTLVVWRIDRLARSMRELLERLTQIEAAGAQFRSLQESFDFNTAMGKFVLQIMGLVAELERQLTIERTTAGMAALKRRGEKFGRKPKLTARQIEEGKELLRKDRWSVARLAQKFGVTEFTIYRNIGGKGKFVRTKKRQYVRRTWKQKD